MSATEKLYWRDSFQSTFEAESFETSTIEGLPSVVVSGTVFYAEGGGQLGDTGTLHVSGAELRVIDTRIDEAGTIHHVLESPCALAPSPIKGAIDIARRRDHMVHHTAQHMLSRALEDEARAPTVSARLGATACTLDVDRPGISDAELARACDLVNAVARDDVVVRAFFPTEEELKALDLRRAPKVQTGIRVVSVGDFDFTPCGGTHCTRSGQIGSVTITTTERYKGKLRVTFEAGARAVAGARARDAILNDLARGFTCGPLDVVANVAKLRTDLKDAYDKFGRARGELLGFLAERILAEHPPDPSGTTIIVVHRDADDVTALRALAGKLAARSDVVAIVTGEAEGADRPVVVQRGESAKFDCGAFFKEKTAAHGGRGGGRPERAEGRLPTSTPLV